MHMYFKTLLFQLFYANTVNISYDMGTIFYVFFIVQMSKKINVIEIQIHFMLLFCGK